MYFCVIYDFSPQCTQVASNKDQNEMKYAWSIASIVQILPGVNMKQIGFQLCEFSAAAEMPKKYVLDEG